MSLVQHVSQQVSVLAQGTVLAEGTPDAIAADRRVQDAYLGRAPGETRYPAAPRRAPAGPAAAAAATIWCCATCTATTAPATSCTG